MPAPYKITEYSKSQAKKLGVDIKLSTSKTKKIDVFRGKEKIASVGQKGYKDYPSYIQEKGKAYADERRRLYRLRHKNDLNSENGKWSSRILW
jgi:hypothetical protein